MGHLSGSSAVLPRLAALCLLLASLVCGEAGPTADEIGLLQLMNRHRLDRGVGDNRIAELIRTRQMTVANPHVWQKQVKRAASGAPPLVMNPALMAAAQALLKGQTKPKDGVRFDAAPAMRTAGYAADGGGLAIFGSDASSCEAAYGQALWNVVGNRDGIDQIVAPEALRAQWREVGMAVGGSPAHPSVVIVLGPGTAKRHIGGMVYADADHDLRYDAGEGRAGVRVSCAGAGMVTGAGGVWWLAIDSDAAVEVAFDGLGFSARRALPAGPGNALVDWRLPDPGDMKAADRLIADAQKVAASTDIEKKRCPLAALLSGTRTAALDDARQAAIDGLVEPLREEFASLQTRTMAALGGEPAEFKAMLGLQQRIWNGAMPLWFKEAEAVFKLRQQVIKVLAMPEEQVAKPAAQVLRQVLEASSRTTDAAFLIQYQVWEEQLAALIPPAPSPAAVRK